MLEAIARGKADQAIVAEILKEPDDNPDDLEALDRIWEEEAVTFGSAAGNKRLSLRVRLGQLEFARMDGILRVTKENLHTATMEIGIFILGSDDDRVLREMVPDLPPRATAHYRVAKKPARIVRRASLDVTFVMFCADRKPVETDLALGRRLAIPIACNDAPQIRGSHAGSNQGARCGAQLYA